MALGFGGSKSRSNSQSSSLDYGFQTSFSDSLSQAISQAQSGGTSFGTQNVWNADILQSLYQDALGAAGATDTNLFKGQAAELYSGGVNLLDRLGVGAGEDYLSARLTDTSSRDAQLQALQAGVGDLFRDELLPAAERPFVSGGTYGGSRTGVGQSMAMREAARAYQQGASSIIASDTAARDSAAGQLMQGRTAAAATGFAGLDSLLGIGQAGLGAELSPYSALASIIGGPTVLTESGSQNWSEASSEQVARAISEALGFNYGTSQSTSSSKAGLFSFGL